ncbi:trimeric intracellular cation channel family protein [Streptomyces adustus]
MASWLSPADVDQVTGYLDLAGVAICGLLGGTVARVAGLDLFGYLAVGTVSGLGGGIIRDTLLQRGTPVALTDAAYLPTAMAGAFLAFLFTIGEAQWNRLFAWLDAAVLSFWAIAGTQKTLAAGLAWLAAVLIGTVSAVGGGAVRDLLLSRVPAVLGGNGLYATVAAAVSGVYIVCARLGAPTIGIVVGILGGMVLRLVANHRNWSLPGGLPLEPTRALRQVRGRTSRYRTRAAGEHTKQEPPDDESR